MKRSDTLLYPKTTSVRKLPENLAPEDLALFQHELQREIPATELLCLKKVKISPEGFLFQTPHVLPESFAIPELNPYKTFYSQLKLWARMRASHIFAENFPTGHWITDEWSMAYFHWITDSLPRLYVIRNQITNAPLLLPKAYEQLEYVRSSLLPFNIPLLRYIEKPTSCEKLFLPTHTAPTGNYNDPLIRDLRNFFEGAYFKGNLKRNKNRIYVSRAGASRRRIINESEVVAVLENRDFEVKHFETLTFEQQVTLAFHTDCLISNHGAGLTNILFMRPSTCVLELRNRTDAHNNCYFSLASSAQLRYFYQLCEPSNEEEAPHLADLVVNCERLKSTLDLMLS
jgi:capsular polysaccharide biosynthesis protein